MDCRKARYCLVASFDDPLSAEDKKELSYHLKDCRACRHEAFYYRELFAAERQVPDRVPSTQFNERLVAEIRLREARSAWPVSNTQPERRRRWSLVYVPALFAAAAVLGFFAFLPGESTNPQQPVATQGPQPNAVTPAGVSESRLLQPIYPRSAPRYVISVRGGDHTQGLMFHMPLSSPPTVTTSDDPFRSTLVLPTRPLQTVRNREQERYILPVVSQAAQRERIY